MNANLSNSLLHKLKSGIKYETELTSTILIGNSNDETNFSHKPLLIDRQVWHIPRAFAIGSSANIKFPQTQLSKTIHITGCFFLVYHKSLLQLKLENKL